MRFSAFAVLVLALAPASASARPDTLGLSCAQARSIVARAGAAVLGSGPHVYERYVASRAFCPGRDNAQAAFAPTRDNPQCAVGYRCVPYRPWLLPGE